MKTVVVENSVAIRWMVNLCVVPFDLRTRHSAHSLVEGCVLFVGY